MDALYGICLVGPEILAFALLFLLWWCNRRTGLAWAPFWFLLAWIYGWIVLPLSRLQFLYFSRGMDMASYENGKMAFLVVSISSFLAGLIVLLKVALATSNLAVLLGKAGVVNPMNTRLAGLYSHHRALGLSMLFLVIVPGFIIRYFFKF